MLSALVIGTSVFFGRQDCAIILGMDVDRRIRLSPGYIASFLVIGVAAFGWMVGFDFGDRSLLSALAVIIAKVGAFGGMAMFAWSLILSGRYLAFDKLFQGLDKMYVAHRFFGTFGLALLIMHPLALVLGALPSQGLPALSLFIAFDEISIALGLLGLYGFVGLVIWSIMAKVRHETFIKVHRLLGLFFLAGAAHAFLAGSVLATNSFMYWYMAALTAAGLATFVHYSLFSDILHSHHTYMVSHVQKLPGDVWDVRLKPRQRIINFLPGQFVYLYFETLAGQEYHPFSIASGKNSRELQFYIKELGDFTKLLDRLREGDKVRVKGPYGGFTFDRLGQDKQLWIAAGIGVTPFLSKARSLQYSKHWPEIEMIYAVSSKKEAIAHRELEDIQHKHRAFNVTLLHETKFGRQSLYNLQEHFGNLSQFAIYICGPPPMLAAYAKQAEELGIENQLRYEEFSF